MAATLKYTITDAVEYIKIDGITGTVAASTHYTLNKTNINKISEGSDGFSICIEMLNDEAHAFTYGELTDPATGVAYVSLAACKTSLDAMAAANTMSTIGTAVAYPGTLFSKKATIAAANVAEKVLNVASAGYITIKADAANTVAICVGISTSVVGTSFELAAGEALSLEHDNLSEIYVVTNAVTSVYHAIGSYK